MESKDGSDIVLGNVRLFNERIYTAVFLIDRLGFSSLFELSALIERYTNEGQGLLVL